MDLWWATWETNGKPFSHLYKKPWRRTSSHQFMTSNLSARQLCSGTMIWNTLVNVHCTLWQEPSFSHTTFRKSFCWQLVHLGYTVVLLQDLTTAFVAGPGFSSTYISKQISLTFHIPLSVQYVSSGWETGVHRGNNIWSSCSSWHKCNAHSVAVVSKTLQTVGVVGRAPLPLGLHSWNTHCHTNLLW